jgi:hypothetical protein
MLGYILCQFHRLSLAVRKQSACKAVTKCLESPGRTIVFSHELGYYHKSLVAESKQSWYLARR